MTITKHFASDNYTGVHPNIMHALNLANIGHTPAYGDDEWTAKLQTVVRTHFGDNAHAFAMFNGTGANVVGLQALTPRWGAVICTKSAHIHQDESTAPQAVAGLKLFPIATDDGKLTPELIQTELYNIGSEHRAQPSVVYISQTTEYGTCYDVDELKAICDFAHKHQMKVFVDGARLSNACVHLNTTFKEMICTTGVDMVSFGGTKNGLMMGECLIVFDKDLANSLKFLRKVGLQTASKMRFISAQLIALLSDNLYFDNAKQANEMASLLADELAKLNIYPTYKVQGNAVFVKMPQEVANRVRQKYAFYDWDTAGTVRLMCGFDTTADDVADLVATIQAAL